MSLAETLRTGGFRTAAARVLAVLVVAAAVAAAQQPVAEPPVMRFAAWNMLNLFDNTDDPEKSDEGTDPKSFIDAGYLARGIDSLQTDVLAVEEVENRAVLERLNARLARPFAYVELLEGNDPRGIDVGILSRFPVEAARSHRLMDLAGGAKFARDFPVYRVRLAKDRAVNVGVVHLKSKLGDKAESDAWRLAEAQAARSILEELRKTEAGTPVVVMGDFNDHRDAATLAPFFTFLKDVTLMVPEKDRFSFVHEKKGEQIDFILASEDLKPVKAGIVHAADNPSDHCPVWADFAAPEGLERKVAAAAPVPVAPKRASLDAKDLVGLEKHLLKEVSATGTVVKVHRSSGGVSLNFHEDYKKALVVFIPKSAEMRFADLDALVGKSLTVAGPVTRYKDQLQVRMTRPEQIEPSK